MCKYGTDVIVRVKIPAHLSSTGEVKWRDFGIDACIAPIVKALQDAGIDMTASCCGHGKTFGVISLADGRHLIVLPSDYDLSALAGEETTISETEKVDAAMRREE